MKRVMCVELAENESRNKLFICVLKVAFMKSMLVVTKLKRKMPETKVRMIIMRVARTLHIPFFERCIDFNFFLKYMCSTERQYVPKLTYTSL